MNGVIAFLSAHLSEFGLKDLLHAVLEKTSIWSLGSCIQH
jgi:hypothetical protein